MLSVGGGCITRMAAAGTDKTTVIGGDAVGPRRRGKSRAPIFTYDGPVAVMRLELDVSDSGVLRRLERQWHHKMVSGWPGLAATTRWPLLSKQHSANPRTDQTQSLDVAGPAENNQPPS